MSEEENSSKGEDTSLAQWWRRVTQRLAGGPRTREDLLDMLREARAAELMDADALLADAPVVRLDSEEAGRFLTGLRRRVPLDDAPQVRVYGPEPKAFLGSARVTAGELISTRLLSPTEVKGLLVIEEPEKQEHSERTSA